MPPHFGSGTVAGLPDVARATPGSGDDHAAPDPTATVAVGVAAARRTLATAPDPTATVAVGVAAARRTLAALTNPVSIDSAGWDVPTGAGLAAERAVRQVGAAIAAQAQDRAAERITMARAALAPNQRAYLEAAGAVERDRAARGVDRWSALRGRILANAYGEVLAGVRPMGPGREPLRTVRSTPALDRLIARAAQHYPREWVARSNADDGPGVNGLYLTHHPHRASYDAGSTITRTRPDGGRFEFAADVLFLRYAPRGWRRPGYAVACHEFAHRCEHLLPMIGELSRVFVARRAIDPATGRRSPLRSYPEPHRTGPAHAEHIDFTDTEWVQPSGLIDVYMGKIYRNRRYHEVLSTGVESLFAGAYGGLIGAGEYRADHEHRDFTLGLLAVL